MVGVCQAREGQSEPGIQLDGGLEVVDGLPDRLRGPHRPTVSPQEIQLICVEALRRPSRDPSSFLRSHHRPHRIRNGLHDFGLDLEEILDYEKLFASLDVDLVRGAARRYLKTDRMVQISMYPEAQVTPEEP